MVGSANAGRPRWVGCDVRRLRRGNADAAALHFRACNIQGSSLGPGGGGRDRSHCCCDRILADIWAQRAKYQQQSLTHPRRQQCMPTGRVRGLRESPALVSAGPPTPSRLPAEKDIDDGRTAAPGVRSTPVGLHGFVTGASIVTPASTASQHSRPSASGGAVGSRTARGVSGIESPALRYCRDVFRYDRLG